MTETSSRGTSRVLLWTVLTVACFAYGVAAGRWSLFPLSLWADPAPPAVSSVSSTVVVPTTQLPLSVVSYAWPEAPESSRTGGGLEPIGDRVLGVDRSGTFFVYDRGGSVRTLGAAIETGAEALRSKTADAEELREAGLDVADLQRPQDACRSDARLDLVDYQESVVPVCVVAQGAEELGTKVVVASLGLDRLDQDGGDGVGVGLGLVGHSTEAGGLAGTKGARRLTIAFGSAPSALRPNQPGRIDESGGDAAGGRSVIG
jgi:hypothetical protein